MQRVADQSAGAVYVKKKCVAGDRDSPIDAPECRCYAECISGISTLAFGGNYMIFVRYRRGNANAHIFFGQYGAQKRRVPRAAFSEAEIKAANNAAGS